MTAITAANATERRSLPRVFSLFSSALNTLPFFPTVTQVSRLYKFTDTGARPSVPWTHRHLRVLHPETGLSRAGYNTRSIEFRPALLESATNSSTLKLNAKQLNLNEFSAKSSCPPRRE